MDKYKGTINQGLKIFNDERLSLEEACDKGMLRGEDLKDGLLYIGYSAHAPECIWSKKESVFKPVPPKGIFKKKAKFESLQYFYPGKKWPRFIPMIMLGEEAAVEKKIVEEQISLEQAMEEYKQAVISYDKKFIEKRRIEQEYSTLTVIVSKKRMIFEKVLIGKQEKGEEHGKQEISAKT